MVAILMLLTIVTCLTVDYLNERAKLRRAALAGVPSEAYPIPQPIVWRTPEDLTRVPQGVFVTPGHTWMEIEPAGGVHVGVDRLPASLLGGLESIETVPAGTAVRQGDRLAVLRRGERALEIKSPVDGVVTAANPELDPGRLAAEPFGAAWLVSLQPRNLGAALRRFFIADEARAFLRHQLADLRDFLVGLSTAGQPATALATATAPDGGLPMDGLAGRLSDEEWQELTQRFF